MAASPSRARIWFRRACKTLFFLLLLAALFFTAGAVYLQRRGLPELARNYLSRQLERHGLRVTFDNLRLSGFRSLAASNVRIENLRARQAPVLHLDHAEVDFGPGKTGWAPQPQAVRLRDGQVSLPMVSGDGPSESVQFGIESAGVSLRASDQWRLDELHGRVLGIDLRLSGIISNASGFQHVLRRSTNRTDQKWQRSLQRSVAEIKKLKFTEPPTIRATFSADGNDPDHFSVAVEVGSATMTTPFGSLEKLQGSARTSPGASGQAMGASVKVSLTGVESPHGAAEEIRITAQANEIFESSIDGRMTIEGSGMTTPWGSAQVKSAKLRIEGSGSQRLELSGPAKFTCRFEEITSAWVNLKEADLHGHISEVEDPPVHDPGWGFWTNLAPYKLSWEANARGLTRSNVEVAAVTCRGDWEAPLLKLRDLRTELYGGSLQSTGRLDVLTREATAGGHLNFDLKKLDSLYEPSLQEWFEQFTWEKPPEVEMQLGLKFDAWTNRVPDWKGRVAPTIALAGNFVCGPGTFRTIPATSARSTFYFTNLSWFLPDLEVTRPEGSVRLVYRLNPRLKRFYWGIDGGIDPKALKPMLSERDFQALDEFEFTSPPQARGEVWGAWRPFRMAMRGRVEATNFTYRGESCDWLEGQVDLTNKVYSFTEVLVRRGEELIRAPAVGLDVTNRMLYFTNAIAMMDPLLVARTINRKMEANLKPYRFDQPPRVIVNGSLHLLRHPVADLWFDVEGGPFHYWKFNLQEIAGQLHWRGESLTISNLQSEFYHGVLMGEAAFDFAPTNRTEFNFDAAVTAGNLHLLMADLNARTNQLEGWLDGQLLVTSANSKEWDSWQGGGHVELRDGLIWEIPLFGIFTPLLNKISPGLGTSPATEGTATFAMTNSVIYTSDLKIFSPALRLQYRGTVDFDRRVDGKVEALILRDVWFFGPLFRAALSPLTKLFEYKVTGTLGHPKAEPLYIPKFLQVPLHPFRSIRKMFPKPQAPAKGAPWQTPPPGVKDY